MNVTLKLPRPATYLPYARRNAPRVPTSGGGARRTVRRVALADGRDGTGPGDRVVSTQSGVSPPQARPRGRPDRTRRRLRHATGRRDVSEARRPDRRHHALAAPTDASPRHAIRTPTALRQSDGDGSGTGWDAEADSRPGRECGAGRTRRTGMVARVGARAPRHGPCDARPDATRRDAAP